MSSHPLILTLLTHLSLLPLPPPPPPLTSPLPLTLTSPTSLRTSLRDHLLHFLTSLLPPPTSTLQNSSFPTPAENGKFVNEAVSVLEGMRKDGIARGGGGGWWAVMGGTVRRSDLAEACGTRYEQVLLALSCEVVWTTIVKLTSSSSHSSSFIDLRLPRTPQEITTALPDLLRSYQDLIRASLEFQSQSDALVRQFERRWEALGERRDNMISSVGKGVAEKVSLERLEAIRTVKEGAWAELVGQWLDMERVDDEEREEFDPVVEVVDPHGGGGPSGNGEIGTGSVGRTEMANALERTMRLPDAAALLQEHLEALPALVSSLEARLVGAEDAVVNRDASRVTSRAVTEALVSEERTFWLERARFHRAGKATMERSTGNGLVAQTGAAVEPASNGPPTPPIHSLLNLTTLAPPRLSALDRATEIIASLRSIPVPIVSAIPPPPVVHHPLPTPTRPLPLARFPPSSTRRTPRKVGLPSAAFDLRRQALGSARKKAPTMGRTPAKMAATPRLGRIGRFQPKTDDGWEEDGEGMSLTLQEMQAAQKDSRGWDDSFLAA